MQQIDPEEKEIIEANCRAYDAIDKKEARIQKKEEIAGKVIDRIKHFKKQIKSKVRSKFNQQLMIQSKQMRGEEIDPEAQMS